VLLASVFGAAAMTHAWFDAGLSLRLEPWDKSGHGCGHQQFKI